MVDVTSDEELFPEQYARDEETESWIVRVYDREFGEFLAPYGPYSEIEAKQIAEQFTQHETNTNEQFFAAEARPIFNRTLEGIIEDFSDDHEVAE